MSFSKGNINRTRPQKHQNRSSFKNDLHDTSKRTKLINSLQVSGVCARCKEIIEWKIKYKKYKPLSAPAKCVGCDQKAVKHAYHVLCSKCASEKAVCAKCNKPFSENNNPLEADKVDDTEALIQAQLKGLPERKRRTILRYIKKLKANEENVSAADVEKLLADFDKFNLSDEFQGLSDDSESNSDSEQT
ncbi:uncharacterized protein C9orf85 homolog [Epargyreus clarus]|uniref:uncharacterized protein C9orf85 homolog n=1 Tax=Epargyreus clarus TaxID=520877 RepID=UPI003C2D8F27